MAKRLVILALVAGAAYGAYYYFSLPPTSLVLTGIVTTHDVTVAPQIGGRLVSLTVKEGDSVTKGQPVAEIDPGELTADRAYYEHSAEGIASQVREGEAALRLQELQLIDQVKQAESVVATAEAQRAAAAADVERAKITLDRTRELYKQQLAPAQTMDEARTTYEAAQARMESTARQVDSARSAVALAKSNFEQTAVRRSQLQTSQHQLAAVGSQGDQAEVRLGSPRFSRRSTASWTQPAREARSSARADLVTLINRRPVGPRRHRRDSRRPSPAKLKVRLPSGENAKEPYFTAAPMRDATQRDVSRTKRDIKTFKTRLRVDNRIGVSQWE